MTGPPGYSRPATKWPYSINVQTVPMAFVFKVSHWPARRAVSYSGDSPASLVPVRVGHQAIDDESAYHQNLLRWIAGGDSRKGDAPQFFLSAFMGRHKASTASAVPAADTFQEVVPLDAEASVPLRQANRCSSSHSPQSPNRPDEPERSRNSRPAPSPASGRAATTSHRQP